MCMSVWLAGIMVPEPQWYAVKMSDLENETLIFALCLRYCLNLEEMTYLL